MSGCGWIASILALSLLFFAIGEPVPGVGMIMSAYFVLMFYNRLHGDGEPTYTYEQCKEEEKEKKRRGKSNTTGHRGNRGGY